MPMSDLHQRLLHQLDRMKAINARSAESSLEKTLPSQSNDPNAVLPHIPAMDDGKSRQEQRHQVQKTGSISYAGGDLNVECEIRDLTSSGAKLRLDSDVTIPSCFDLTVLPEKTTKKAQVCWRDSQELGIQFIEQS